MNKHCYHSIKEAIQNKTGGITFGINLQSGRQDWHITDNNNIYIETEGLLHDEV